MTNIISNSNEPTVYGTGLVALDIVISSDPGACAYQWAGGTCGNVLTILSYLGWTAFPIARLNDEASSQCVLYDLKKWNVREDFIHLEPRASVPVITQEISKGREGKPKHKFHWRNCPKCGAFLPNYKSVTLPAVSEVKERVKSGDLYFFDRTSPGSIALARHFKALGAIIFFEPSAKGDQNHFEEAVKLSDIVKYSNQRFSSVVTKNTEKNRPHLEIQTLGEEGLRYRTKSRKTWLNLSAFEPYETMDTCGCGDWTTAGIIHGLCSNGRKEFLNQTATSIKSGLLYGQALGAWACGFEGARSGMYRITKRTFEKDILEILRRSKQVKRVRQNNQPLGNVSDGLCPACPQ